MKMKSVSFFVLAGAMSVLAGGAVAAEEAKVSLDVSLQSKMATAPAIYRLQSATSGLSVDERKRSLYTLTVDGQVVIGNASSMLKRLTLPSPGSHTLELTVRTPSGKVMKDSVVVDLEPNKAPVCNIKVTVPDMSGPRPNKWAGVSLNPDCRDPDGRMVRTNWYMNGSDTPMKQSSSLVVPAWKADRSGPNCFSVKFVAFDDQGNKSEGSYTFPACEGGKS